MNQLILAEPLPTFALIGGGAFTLVEPTPLLSMRGSSGGALVLTEPIPSVSYKGYGGQVTLTEPIPTASLTGKWLPKGALALREPLPVFAFTGKKASGLVLTEKVPKLSLAGWSPGRLSLTEKVPTLAMTGDNATPGIVLLTEPAPVLSLIGFLPAVPERDNPDDPAAGEIRPLSDYTAWAVNTANGAHSGFTNFEFSSLLKLNGKYYGTRDDGLFTLTGDTDDGAEIPALNVWGPSNLGTDFEKRFYRAMFSIRDRSGELKLTVTADEQLPKEFTIDPSTAPGLRVLTVRGRRDLHGFVMAPSIQNINGGDFDITGFEIEPQVLKRGRGRR